MLRKLLLITSAFLVEGYSAAPAQSSADGPALAARAAAVIPGFVPIAEPVVQTTVSAQVPVHVYPRLSAANYQDIFCAAKAGDMKGVQEFITNGIDPRAVDIYGETILHSAATSGNLDLVEYLVGKGVDPRAIAPGQLTVLHWAAKSGNLYLVQYLVEQHRVDPRAATIIGDTILHWATANGHLDIVEYLVDKGVDPRAIAPGGLSVLGYATKHKHFHILAYFAYLGLEIPSEYNPQVNLIRQRARKVLEGRQIRGPIDRQPMFNEKGEKNHHNIRVWQNIGKYTDPVGVSREDVANNRYIFPIEVDNWDEQSDESRSSVKARIRGIPSEEYLFYILEKSRLGYYAMNLGFHRDYKITFSYA